VGRTTATYYSFVETPIFTRRMDDLGSIDVLLRIQDDLLEKPTRGSLIKGSGGARKARVADPKSNRGKSGSYRYIYLYLERHGIIYLTFFYGKKEQVNLSPEQTKRIASIVRLLKEEEPAT